jgi:predicted nucleic acid-binding Zn ribbon protein
MPIYRRIDGARTCARQACGREFTAPYTRGRRSEYCSAECRRKEENRMQRANRQLRPMYRICQVCDLTFPHPNDRKTCSDRCEHALRVKSGRASEQPRRKKAA